MIQPVATLARVATHDPIWAEIRRDAETLVQDEPVMAGFLHAGVLVHRSLEDALSYQLANKLAGAAVGPLLMRQVIDEAFASDRDIPEAVRADFHAVRDRDPACRSYLEPLLYFKGFHAIQAYRIAHWLWRSGRRGLALFFQNRISEAFGVDIHPAARIGRGILLDHGTGVVIGETVVIENCVSMLQGVTLGGTGKETGDRHPKVRAGALIGANATILGNIEVGEGAKVGAGSVVLQNVPPHCTVAGVPAVVKGCPDCPEPARAMDHWFPCGNAEQG
ncbi:serine O-acetyltransferase [Zavarzinia sp. CC-PAN008]|uniref:serine O-acetyltransferase n=1 Tax=Zavarzinia sp. CC-PAN008 TaxID=3243332 RepID=UPI003F747996